MHAYILPIPSSAATISHETHTRDTRPTRPTHHVSMPAARLPSPEIDHVRVMYAPPPSPTTHTPSYRGTLIWVDRLPSTERDSPSMSSPRHMRRPLRDNKLSRAFLRTC